MKQLLILFSALAALTVKSQNTKRTAFIGFSFSPDYNFRVIKSDNKDIFGGFTTETRNDIEIGKFGYTAGVSLVQQVSKQVVLETGVQFTNMGYKTKKQQLSFETPTPGIPIRAQVIYAYQYMSIPIKARITFGEKLVRLASSIGFNTSFLTTAKQTVFLEEANGEINKTSTSNKREFKAINIMPFVGIGVNYALNQKLQVFAEPTLRYGLIKTTSTPVKESLWNVGLNMGVYYAIK
jgi:Outer membrane protein beta-barrel domain